MILFLRGVVDYVISGSGAKTSGKSSNRTKNLKNKRATSKFFSSANGFVGFQIRGSVAEVTFVDSKGKEIYSYSKQNPRVSGIDVIG